MDGVWVALLDTVHNYLSQTTLAWRDGRHRSLRRRVQATSMQHVAGEDVKMKGHLLITVRRSSWSGVGYMSETNSLLWSRDRLGLSAHCSITPKVENWRPRKQEPSNTSNPYAQTPVRCCILQKVPLVGPQRRVYDLCPVRRRPPPPPLAVFRCPMSMIVAVAASIQRPFYIMSGAFPKTQMYRLFAW